MPLVLITVFIFIELDKITVHFTFEDEEKIVLDVFVYLCVDSFI